MDAGPSHSRYAVRVCLLAGLFFSSSSIVVGTRFIASNIIDPPGLVHLSGGLPPLPYSMSHVE
jgi:hypothetical protein